MNAAPSIRQNTDYPAEADFTPLQEHQQQTPSTFFGAKPILYYYRGGFAFSAPKEKLRSEPAFAKFHTELGGADEGDAVVRDVEVWVSSENFLLFQKTPAMIGVTIPYPSIALHATMKRKGVDALLMNLSLNDPENVNAAEDIDILELILLPPSFDKEDSQTSCIHELFQALNKCAELHPDIYDSDDGQPDLTAPGATGWITADNMDEYMDEDGNFAGRVISGAELEELGPGAGTVRLRGADDEEEDAGVDGLNGHEGKYQRTG